MTTRGASVDFALDETQQEIADLTAQVLSGPAGDEPDVDAHAWQAVVDAGLVGLALPEQFGGDGVGLAGAAVVLTELGRRALPTPALATLALGALPLARHGTDRQREAVLPRVAKEGLVLTAALHEPSEPLPRLPRTVARRDGDSYVVTGTKLVVPYADLAHRILTPVSFEASRPGILLIDPKAAGVSVVRTPMSGPGATYRVRFDDVVVPAVDLLGSTDLQTDLVADLYRHATVGAAVFGDGLLAGALALSVEHVGTRHQFGRPLATFQAVSQLIADVYVSARAMHLAAWSSCWRLSTGLDPGPDPEVAAYWVAEELPKAIGICHHLHGGLGLDRSYPLHRYSAAASDLSRLVGGTDRGLDRLAAELLGQPKGL
jgi:alkylation response protein AidB-like acyl-CoA dehydrogenase